MSPVEYIKLRYNRQELRLPSWSELGKVNRKRARHLTKEGLISHRFAKLLAGEKVQNTQRDFWTPRAEIEFWRFEGARRKLSGGGMPKKWKDFDVLLDLKEQRAWGPLHVKRLKIEVIRRKEKGQPSIPLP